ncbi:MAG: hypothetical protein CMI53_03085 [Parcubacteria group bacterium]|nr:hypothetical protein [Parcubacteria group bacterium]|tara:strand:+ start:992 stop:2365 length:1374 start_codon:yes stop_codon:yes gene_type:complete
MELKIRRSLYLTFIGAFIIITPLLILYTTGYRYNFKKHKIEKTGILYLDSQPKNAKIFINDKYENTTPNRFSRILPDVYQIKIEKDGYYPWQKELEVKSNLTTFGRDIVLFKINSPINIVNQQINILNISPDHKKIVYSVVKENVEEIRLLNLKNKSDFLVKEFNNRTFNQLDFVQWSPSQKKVMIKEIIGDFNQYLIVDIESLKIKELFDITRLNFSKLAWDNSDDNYLYGLRKSVLHQIDLVTNSTRPLLSDPIQDFQVQNDNIYYITKIGNESFLNKRIIINQKAGPSEKIKLPSPSEYTIEPLINNLLVLLDKKNNDLFIINEKSFDQQDVSRNIVLQDKAKKVIWSKDLKNILFYTDFEISIFNLETSQKNLITRYGEIINQALWYPGQNYIIYQAGNSIRAIESGPTEIRNDLELAKLDQISSMVVDDDGENLYFKATSESLEGIFQLAIQ